MNNIWRLSTMDLQELLRRLRVGESRGAIVRAMKMSPNTVKTYRRWATQQGLLEGELPDLTTLEALRRQTYSSPARPRHPNVSSLEEYRAEIAELVSQNRKPRAIWSLLDQRHPGCVGSESAVRRMVKGLKAQELPEATVRIETEPGDVAQVDFGYVGQLLDEDRTTRRKAWVFVMTLGWSRHQYAEVVLDQTIATWLLCHQHAFEYFGGVPQRIVLDNLKAAIVRAYTRDQDVEVQQSYRECAEHYGFLIDPCLPRKPQHKGKVERGVGYLKQNFLPRLRVGLTLAEANRLLRDWLVTTAGLRTHGTTRVAPLARFEQTERAVLQPLPQTTFDPAQWKQCKLHRDCHITFEQSYYSAPYRYVGQSVWLRAGLREVRLFSEKFDLLATHLRAQQPGQRLTNSDHWPAHKVQALHLTRQTCQVQAERIGPATSQIVAELLAARPVDKFRIARRVLTLAEEHTPVRLEAASRLALTYGDPSFCTLKRILQNRLESLAPQASATGPLPPETLVFARTPEELAQAILGGANMGGVRWN